MPSKISEGERLHTQTIKNQNSRQKKALHVNRAGRDSASQSDYEEEESTHKQKTPNFSGTVQQKVKRNLTQSNQITIIVLLQKLGLENFAYQNNTQQFYELVHKFLRKYQAMSNVFLGEIDIILKACKYSNDQLIACYKALVQLVVQNRQNYLKKENEAKNGLVNDQGKTFFKQVSDELKQRLEKAQRNQKKKTSTVFSVKSVVGKPGKKFVVRKTGKTSQSFLPTFGNKKKSSNSSLGLLKLVGNFLYGSLQRSQEKCPFTGQNITSPSSKQSQAKGGSLSSNREDEYPSYSSQTIQKERYEPSLNNSSMLLQRMHSHSTKCSKNGVHKNSHEKTFQQGAGSSAQEFTTYGQKEQYSREKIRDDEEAQYLLPDHSYNEE